MAKRKRAQVSARTVRKWRIRVAEGLAAARAAESVLRKLHKSLGIVVTKSR